MSALSPADIARRLRMLGTTETEARDHRDNAAFTGAYVLQLVGQLREVYASHDAVRGDRDHWKSNAEEAVRRKRVAEEYRDDFRARAIAAEELVEELQKRVAELESQAREP